MIDNPHVIKMYEYIENKKYGFLIMEYCDGGDLEYI